MQRGTSVQHVQSVVGIEDRVLRNYWVTQTYSDLAAALTALFGADTANWCTFATWASWTVGRNLRGEELPGWLHREVVLPDGMMGLARAANQTVRQAFPGGNVHHVLPEHVGDVLRSHFGVCATSLSEGNTEVFAEIAPVAAQFLALNADPGGAPAATRERVLDACDGALEFEGRNRLRDGFSLWCDAMEEEDPGRRSQLILGGSLQLGAHEQNHLQQPIADSMVMGLGRSLGLLKERVTTGLQVPPPVERLIDKALDPLARVANDKWGDLMTQLLGTIETPDGVLRLDHDVPPLPGQPFVPSELDPVVVEGLAEVLKRFDRAGNDGLGSRADDWMVLDHRMNFISNLFLSRHHRQSLFRAPFTSEELADIEADRIPEPPLRQSRSRSRDDGRTQRELLPPPSVGVDRFTDSYTEELRGIGDAPADAAVASFFEATGLHHDALYRRLASTSAWRAADEDLPGVAEFVTEVTPWPAWADADMIGEGQRVFGEFGPQLGMGLFMASLPADYGFAKGVQALARTARLSRDPKRRFVETGQMIIDAMTPGALEPGERGYRTIRHVRLMHAAVRHVLLRPAEIDDGSIGASKVPPWDNALGVPINQLQLLGTLFSFGVQGIQSLARSGVRLSRDRAEAYIHAWNLVGHQIGILDELLPLSLDDSEALWERGKRKEYGPTDAGREMTAAAIECMQELFGFTHLPGLPATGIRFYLGDETADMLGVPRSDWTRLVFEMMRQTDWLYTYALVRLPGTGPLAAALGRRVWHGFESYGRDGDRPQFEVTDELKAAWGMGA